MLGIRVVSFDDTFVGLHQFHSILRNYFACYFYQTKQEKMFLRARYEIQ